VVFSQRDAEVFDAFNDMVLLRKACTSGLLAGLPIGGLMQVTSAEYAHM